MVNVDELVARRESELSHHGVKGMRWGVRRTDAQLAAAAAIRKQKTIDKIEIKERKAALRSKQAEARDKMAVAKRKEAETRKLTKESRTQIALQKSRQRAEERKAKIQRQEEQRKQRLKDNKQTDVNYSYKDYRNMSDEQLKSVVNRMNTEKQYRELNPKPPSAMSKIIKTVGSTAKTAKEVYDVADALGLTDKILPKDSQKSVDKALSALAKKKPKKKGK